MEGLDDGNQRQGSGTPSQRQASSSALSHTTATTATDDDRHGHSSSSEDESGDRRVSRITKSLSSATKAVKQLFVKDDAYFHQIFPSLPRSERLLEDYSCALLRDMLVHGRLYITTSHFCFHANIFGWETSLSLPCKDVLIITKEKNILRIPTIIVSTSTEKYTFQSFISRDSSFKLMFRVWQNSLLEHPLGAEELLHSPMMQRREFSLSHVPAIIRRRKRQPSAASGNDTGNPASPISDASGKPQREVASTREPPTLPLQNQFGDEPDKQPLAEGPTAESESSEPASCGCSAHDHKGRNSAHQTFQLSVDELFDLYFSFKFMDDFYTAQHAQDYVMPEWNDVAPPEAQRPAPASLPDFTNCPLPLHREGSFKLALTGFSFGPKRTLAIQKQSLEVAEPGKRYVLTSEIYTPKVPYGGVFYTANRQCVTRNTAHTATISVYSEIRYQKGEPWALTKSIIEKNGYDGIKAHFRKLTAFTAAYIAKARASGGIGAGEDESNGSFSLLSSIRRSVQRTGSVDQVSFASIDARNSEEMAIGWLDRTQLLSGQTLLQGLIVLLLVINIYFFLRIQTLERALEARTALPAPGPGDFGAQQELLAQQQAVLKKIRAALDGSPGLDS